MGEIYLYYDWDDWDWDYGGAFILLEEDDSGQFINGSNIIFDFVPNENVPSMHRDCRCIHNGASWDDEALSKVMYYDGKKISMPYKIEIFDLVLKKLEGSQHQIEKLTRDDKRNKKNLDDRLIEVFHYIKKFVQSRDKDFMQLISKLNKKSKNTPKK